MRNTTNINGSIVQNEEQKEIQLPVSLRDYFAAKAMSAYLARPNLPISVTDEQIASAGYDMADAMLKAREQ